MEFPSDLLNDLNDAYANYNRISIIKYMNRDKSDEEILKLLVEDGLIDVRHGYPEYYNTMKREIANYLYKRNVELLKKYNPSR